jgi:hypothetical protein
VLEQVLASRVKVKLELHSSIKATREGLVGHKTSSGYIIDVHVPFVALPDAKALFKAVKVTSGDRSVIALVLDVGPWNVTDHDYVFGDARPQAESGTDLFYRTTNHAGIDLGEYVWNFLRMKDNTNVDWQFVE